MKVAIFTGSDLRNYGGGEKDVLRWVSKLKDSIDLTIFTPIDRNVNNHRVKKEDLPKFDIIWYRAKKIKILKDILPLQKIDLSPYDKVYSMTQGFIINSIIERKSKKFLLGIHSQSMLMDRPIEQNKLWKRLFFKLLYPLQKRYVMKADEIRVQNLTDLERLKILNYSGKIWNVPPSMFEITPEPEDSNNFYVVWVNRVSPEKRPEELSEIAKKLKNIEFHAIGSGPLSYLFDNISNIKKLGFLDDSSLSKELQHASLYISTSRGETFGMSAVEALAHGVPTITYDVPGLRDYNQVVKGQEEFVDKIQEYHSKWVSNRDEYLEMRRRIRKETLQRFSDDVVIPQIREMISYL